MNCFSPPTSSFIFSGLFFLSWFSWDKWLLDLLQRAIAEHGMYKSCLIFLFAYKYDITHRLSQHLAALSRNSTEQGKKTMGTEDPEVQLQTTKANQLIISGTRFFGRNLTMDLKPDGQKELKNVGYMLFPRFLSMPKFWAKFSVYITSVWRLG